jgi:hypothetical protein
MATAASSGRIASRCSASGDVCYGVFDDRGTIRFQLTLAAKYFTRYRVCVRPPRGATTCRSFPVKRVGSQFGGAVKWNLNFPYRGLGRYRVTWRQGAQALGPALVFQPSTQV